MSSLSARDTDCLTGPIFSPDAEALTISLKVSREHYLSRWPISVINSGLDFDISWLGTAPDGPLGFRGDLRPEDIYSPEALKKLNSLSPYPPLETMSPKLLAVHKRMQKWDRKRREYAAGAQAGTLVEDEATKKKRLAIVGRQKDFLIPSYVLNPEELELSDDDNVEHEDVS